MTEKNRGEQGKCVISKVLYVVAALVAVLGIAMLAANVFVFKSTVDQYVMQGYPASVVMASMIPSQLLPSIFEALGLYGGLTCVLVGLGVANKKLTALGTQRAEGEPEEQEETCLLGEGEEIQKEDQDPMLNQEEIQMEGQEAASLPENAEEAAEPEK